VSPTVIGLKAQSTLNQAGERRLLKISRIARLLGVTVRRAEALCNPMLVPDPIPSIRLPACDKEPAATRIYADELFDWVERQRWVTSTPVLKKTG